MKHIYLVVFKQQTVLKWFRSLDYAIEFTKTRRHCTIEEVVYE